MLRGSLSLDRRRSLDPTRSISPKQFLVPKHATSTKIPVTNNISYVAGNSSDRLGNRKISPSKPWGESIPAYNPDTSYGRAYNPDYGEHHHVKKVIKEVKKSIPNASLCIENGNSGRKINHG